LIVSSTRSGDSRIGQLAGARQAQVVPGRDGDVALDLDAPGGTPSWFAPVTSRVARAGLVGEHAQAGDAHRAEASGRSAQRGADLGVLGGPRLGGAGRVAQLGLDQLIVAAQQHQHRLAIESVDERLDLAHGRGRAGGEFREIVDAAHTRRGEFLGRGEGGAVLRRGSERLLHVRGVAAGGAGGDPVLAGIARQHELDRFAASHRPRGGLDRERLQAAAREDPAIGVEVLLERLVEAGRVEVERVGVLHGELAHPQQTGLRPRLVAELSERTRPAELPVAASSTAASKTLVVMPSAVSRRAGLSRTSPRPPAPAGRRRQFGGWQVNSCAPIAFISARTTAVILRATATPSGSSEYTPDISWRM
jgi:hypothetical protein